METKLALVQLDLLGKEDTTWSIFISSSHCEIILLDQQDEIYTAGSYFIQSELV